MTIQIAVLRQVRASGDGVQGGLASGGVVHWLILWFVPGTPMKTFMSLSTMTHFDSAFVMRACSLPVMMLAAQAAFAADAPNHAIVEKVLKAGWDKAASSTNPRSALTLNSVRLGTAYKATAQEVQVEGFPAAGTVTPAIVDFTVRTYYTGETQALHRVREARVYKDKMGDWAVMTGSPKGEDTRTKEPAVK